MKKLLVLLLTALLLTACSGKEEEADTTITVAATAEPHATILEYVAPLLEEKGYTLEIEVLDNYFIFNRSLDNGDVDANYFQHRPFFENEVAEYGYDIVEAAGIHIEPFGIYSSKYETIDDIENGSRVIISNSIADHGRILKILEDAGLITIAEDVDVIDATVADIVDNPKNLVFEEVNPELVTTAYTNGDGDLFAINGNYALGAGLDPVNDSLLLESVDSSNPYVNILAVKNGDEDSPKIGALVDVLKSDEVKAWITEHFGGSVIIVD